MDTYGHLPPVDIPKPLAYLANFSYLCIMETQIRSIGRMELAQAYFPQLTPRAAWKKFKFFLQDYEELSEILTANHRTFTPAQVQAIISNLGAP